VIWQPVVPSKITCLCWKIFYGKLATCDNLQRKGLTLVNRCVLCNSNLETVNHLFLGCEYAHEVWFLLSSKLSIFGPFHITSQAFIKGWKGLNCITRFSRAMKVLLHATFWFLWKERNDRIFRDFPSTPSSTFHKIWFTAGDWLSVFGYFSAADLSTWRRLVFDNG
ncbi:hypothetical protein LINPERHAP1_LOCUS4326, partial [Linum perenne]